MLMPLQKRLVLLLKSPPPGMFDLILDFMVVSKPRSVQSSRWDGAIFLIIPGTSCLATIVLSPGTKYTRQRTKVRKGAAAIQWFRIRTLKAFSRSLNTRIWFVSLKSGNFSHTGGVEDGGKPFVVSGHLCV